MNNNEQYDPSNKYGQNIQNNGYQQSPQQPMSSQSINNVGYYNQNSQYSQYNPNINNPYQGMQPNPYGMPVNNIPLDSNEKSKLIFAALILVAGWFVAGLVCGIVAVVVAQSINKKNLFKNIVTVLGVIEAGLMVIYLISNL